MGLEIELSEFDFEFEFSMGDSHITRELVMQYIGAGILFPEEIRYAEQLLRKHNQITEKL